MKTPDEIARECAQEFVDLLRESSACSVAAFEMVEAFKPLTDALAEAREENERLKRSNRILMRFAEFVDDWPSGIEQHDMQATARKALHEINN